MEVKVIAALLAATILPACTSTHEFNMRHAEAFHVEGYTVDEEQGCVRDDVDINDRSAKEFFHRSRQVEYRVIHDSYDIAPCSASGSLIYRGETCHWNINAGGTGWISCTPDSERLQYNFACDSCQSLLTPGKQ